MEKSLSTAYTGDDLFQDDIGNNRDNQYSVRFPSWSAEKTTSFAIGTTISVGLWFEGITLLYINRSYNRATHESGITKLTVFEIAT